MLLHRARRGVAAGLVAGVASFAIVLAGPTPHASAAVPALAPVIPIVAAETGGAAIACVTSVVCGGVVAAGIIVGGAWWAFNNQDKIASWTGQDLTTGGTANVPGVGWAWRGTIPSPAAGPYVTYGQTYTTTNNPATDTRPFAVTCINDSGCAVGATTVPNQRWWCVDLISGAVAASSRTEGTNGSVSSAGGVKLATGGTPCNQAYTGVGMVVDIAHGLEWRAAGTWQLSRTYTATVKCKTPGGGTRTVSRTGTRYASTGGGALQNVSVPGCLDGEYVSSVVVSDCLAGVCQTTVNWNVATTAETTYPQCLGSTGVLGSCALLVKYQGVACTDLIPECANWYSATVNGSTSYQCWWGPYQVPLSSCSPVRYSYDPGATPGTDGLPSPAPTSTLNPTYQPQPQPTATATPQTQATTGANPTPFSTTAVIPFPSTTPTAGAPPVTVPLPPAVPDGQSCLSAAWSWNPIDWVFVPVKCAFIWAFVPNPVVVSQLQTKAVTDWSTSSPGQFMTAGWNAIAPIATLGSGVGSGCGGLTYSFPILGPGQAPTSVTFLNSCDAPFDTLAPIVKAILTLVVLVYGVWECVRVLGVALGWNIGKPREWEQGELF